MYQMGIQPEEENNTGESVFPETDLISFVIHTDEYRATQGSADLTLVKIRCFI